MTNNQNPIICRNLPKTGNYYSIRTYCTNCGKHDYVYIKTGVRKAGLTIPCDKCGCEITL